MPDVTGIVRDLFSDHLDVYGVTGTWRARNAVVPETSSSDISEAYRRKDPTDSSWVSVLADDSLWTNTQVSICFDVPGQSQAENVGMMVAGTSVGYVLYSLGVKVGDVIDVGGTSYAVDGSRLPHPPAYRELTLRKVV